MAQIPIDHDALARFCQANRIRKLSLFGSVLREDFRPDSDVDVLVEFEEDAHVTFFEIARMEHEMSPLFSGRTVDLRTPEDLGKYMRKRVMAGAQPLYAH